MIRERASILLCAEMRRIYLGENYYEREEIFELNARNVYAIIRIYAYDLRRR
jgi:hypothetical protein